AGGRPDIFLRRRGSLPSGVAVVGVQMPGHGRLMNERPFTRLSPLVRWLAQSLRDRLGAPYAFFGHSMGALVSFEVARELRRLRAPTPLHLWASAFRAPHLPDPDPPISELPTPRFIAELR